jgi:hypothetical protein
MNVEIPGTPQLVNDIAAGSLLYLPMHKECRLALKVRSELADGGTNYVVWLNELPTNITGDARFDLVDASNFDSTAALLIGNAVFQPKLNALESSDFSPGDVLLQGDNAKLRCGTGRQRAFVDLGTGLFSDQVNRVPGIKVSAWRIVVAPYCDAPSIKHVICEYPPKAASQP